MNHLFKNLIKEKLPIAFIVFYSVGLVLYFTSFTRNWFVLVTPYTLVLVIWAIFLHHKEWTKKTIFVLTGIFVISIIIEIFGVTTGEIFGVYSYGKGLGVKVVDVPIVIGLNWVFLVYASNSIISKFVSKNTLIVLGAASLMVFYDILLEKVAPLIDMWQFEKNDPPIRNYVAWFFLALCFNMAIQYFEVNTQNKPARWLFFIQMVFFTIIAAQNMF